MLHKILILLTLCAYCHGNEPIFRNDYKYYSEANGWLKVHLGPMKWPEARFMCSYEGAVLASPLNDQLQNSIVRLLRDKKTNSDVWYLGIRPLFAEGFFMSIEGTDIEDMPIRWAEDEPARADGCIVFYSNNGTVGTKECSSAYPFICFKAKENVELVRNECGTIDNGYRLIGTRECFKYHNESVSWEEAYKICSAEGALLSTNYNVDLNEFSKTKVDAVFVGYRLIRNVWYSVKGNVMNPYTTGQKGTNFGARNWYMAFKSFGYYNSEHPFLCEKKPDKIV